MTRHATPYRNPRLAAFLLLLLAAVFWGAGNVANKTALAHIGPLTTLFWRCLLALLILAPFRGRTPPATTGWLPSAFGVAGLFVIATVLQQIAYLSATVTNISFLVNTASVMTPAVGWLILGERPGPRILCAALLTLAGAYLMSGATLSLANLNTGDMLCLASGVGYAGWMVALGRHAMTHGRALDTTLTQFAVTALVTAPIALWYEGLTLSATLAAWHELAFLALFSTAAAFGLMIWAQRIVPAAIAAVLVSAESVFGAIGAFLILHERPPLMALTGGALILLAIGIVAFSPPPRAAEAPFQVGVKVRA